ncbi:MAG: response regulator transcription factor [Dehalococcoidia bacterium]|nr:response regulator transcription factor [Dehalococcoidia bacterium]
MSNIRVFLVDDNFVARRGLRTVLESEDGMEVCGEASSGTEALKRLADCPSDVVLMDIRMPDIDGVETTAELMRHDSKVRVLVATVIDNPTVHMSALLAGARGYMVYGHFTPEELVDGIRAVASGERINVPPLPGAFDADSCALPSDALTSREDEILRLIAAGRDNREIATVLKIEEKTVKNHINSIYSKIGVANRQEAIYFMLRRLLRERRQEHLP